jgi:Cu+-exporting ATPase
VFAARGIRCAACSKAIERAVGALAGVNQVQVNVATSRVSVDFDSALTSLPAILQVTAATGFEPVPLLGELSRADFIRERRVGKK